MNTWRKHPFKEGCIYKAKESFTGFFKGGQFVAGQNYLFESAGYSRYDSSTVFTFQEQGSSEPTYWWWHDDHPDTQCQERFEIFKHESA